MSTPSAIVIGAGIVGAACAEALARAGCHVTVLESAFAGAGATGAAMGHLVVMDDSEAQFALTSFSRRLWAESAGSLPPEIEDDPCGTLWVAADEEEMGHVRKKAAFYEARGEKAEVLDAAALRRAEPQLRPGLVGALRVAGRPRPLPAGGRAPPARAGPPPRHRDLDRVARRGDRAGPRALLRGPVARGRPGRERGRGLGPATLPRPPDRSRARATS